MIKVTGLKGYKNTIMSWRKDFQIRNNIHKSFQTNTHK